MNRFGLSASWTLEQFCENLLMTSIAGICLALFIGVIVIAWKRGLRGEE
jgi:hypothetical protein